METNSNETQQITNETIGAMVANDHRKADVFRKFDLDFCCNGAKTLGQACYEKGINKTDVESALAQLSDEPTSVKWDFNNWELDKLISHIVETHHHYIRQAIPEIEVHTQKVAMSHGTEHPETIEIARHFSQLAGELSMHMQKEEGILFPYITQMVAAKADGTGMGSNMRFVQGPINVMLADHEVVGNELRTISGLSKSYTPPADSCHTFSVAYAKLKEFESDLIQHIHLENNILFPKAIDLESGLMR